MQPQTITMVKAALDCDPYIDPRHKRRILNALKNDGSGKRRIGTIKQAAAIMGCHPLTISRHAQRGNLRQIKLSPRCVRYDLDEVERFAQEGIQSD